MKLLLDIVDFLALFMYIAPPPPEVAIFFVNMLFWMVDPVLSFSAIAPAFLALFDVNVLSVTFTFEPDTWIAPPVSPPLFDVKVFFEIMELLTLVYIPPAELVALFWLNLLFYEF